MTSEGSGSGSKGSGISSGIVADSEVSYEIVASKPWKNTIVTSNNKSCNFVGLCPEHRQTHHIRMTLTSSQVTHYSPIPTKSSTSVFSP